MAFRGTIFNKNVIEVPPIVVAEAQGVGLWVFFGNHLCTTIARKYVGEEFQHHHVYGAIKPNKGNRFNTGRLCNRRHSNNWIKFNELDDLLVNISCFLEL